ncbi:MAG: pilus assembly protein N-terminal domain-containing protein [Alphaproteobacteria bacterium]
MPAYAADTTPSAATTAVDSGIAATAAVSDIPGTGLAPQETAELPKPLPKPPTTFKIAPQPELVEPSAGTADAPLRLTPDRAQTLQLDKDAVSVIVTNPVHASVLLDTPRTLVIMPRTPGSTSFTVLDGKGGIVLQKTVIVAASAEANYVRIRRMCAPNDNTCTPAAYYYCPDGCYEVQPVQPLAGEVNMPPPTGGGRSSSGAVDGSGVQIEQSPVQIQTGPGFGGATP